MYTGTLKSPRPAHCRQGRKHNSGQQLSIQAILKLNLTLTQTFLGKMSLMGWRAGGVVCFFPCCVFSDVCNISLYGLNGCIVYQKKLQSGTSLQINDVTARVNVLFQCTTVSYSFKENKGKMQLTPLRWSGLLKFCGQKNQTGTFWSETGATQLTEQSTSRISHRPQPWTYPWQTIGKQ